MNRSFNGFVLARRRGRRRRARSRCRCSSSTRRSRRWCCGSASRSATSSERRASTSNGRSSTMSSISTSAFSRSTTSGRKCSCRTISGSRSTPSCATASTIRCSSINPSSTRQRRQRAARRHAQFGAAPHAVGASITDIVRDKRDELMADIRDQMIAGRRALRPRRHRRAHQARRPAGGEFRGCVPPHADRAAAARRDLSRARLAAGPADQGGSGPEGDGHRPRTAQQKSEQIRGEGDGERNRIFAEVYGSDPEFFAFYRSMQAYQNALTGGTTRALISPKADFFRYFSTPTSGDDGDACRRGAGPRRPRRIEAAGRATERAGSNSRAVGSAASRGPLRADKAHRPRTNSRQNEHESTPWPPTNAR